MSITLFALFINDLASEINKLDKGVNLDDMLISMLLCADDIGLIAGDAQDLQLMINCNPMV